LEHHYEQAWVAIVLSCFHGFDSLAGDTAIGQDALDFTYSNYADFYDRYLACN